MSKYFIATSLNDLGKIFKAVEKPRISAAIYRTIVENNEDSIRFFERMFRQHGKVFINATHGIVSSYIHPEHDEIMSLERYKL